MKHVLRLIRFHTSYFAFSILGLTVTIVGSSLLYFFLIYSFSFDQFHPEADNIVRLTNDIQFADRPIYKTAQTPIPLGSALTSALPEVSDNVTIIKPYEDALLVKSNKVSDREKKFVFANSSLFHVFSWEILNGSAIDLDKPLTIAITENTALKYFGRRNVLNEVLTVSDSINFTVALVVKPMKNNSHFNADFIASSTSAGALGIISDWGGTNAYTYLKLNGNVNQESLEEVVNKTAMAAMPSGAPNIYTYRVQKLTDIHLHSQLNNEWKKNADYPALMILLGLALTITLIGTFNFSHLSASAASKRLQKAGIRRCLGASKAKLIQELVVEAFIIACITAICSLAIIVIFREQLSSFIHKTLLTNPLDLQLLWIILTTSIFSALAGSIYPIFIVTSTRLHHALKGKISSQKTSAIKQWITASQFALSTTVAIFTLVILKQLNFINNQDLGIDLSNKISIPMYADASINNKSEALIQSFSNQSFISSVAVSSGTPGRDLRTNPVQVSKVLSDTDEWYDMRSLAVDETFAKSYNLKLVAGRNFDKTKDHGKNVYLVNQAFVDYFSWTEPHTALDYNLNWRGFLKGSIVGVVDDFHYFGLKSVIQPTVIAYHPKWFNYITIEFEKNADQVQALIKMEEIWHQTIIDRPLEYYSVSDDFTSQYDADLDASKKAMFFSVVAILMAGFGIFSYILFETVSKRKEIAIRRVVGAGLPQMLSVFFRRIVQSFAISCLVIVPLSYYLSQKWLESFFYRISLGVEVYITVIAGMITISLSIVAIQVINSYNINPAETLMDE